MKLWLLGLLVLLAIITIIMKLRLLGLLVLLSVITVQVIAEPEPEPTRRDLISKLLNTPNYDANIIPEFDEDYATNVSIQISITDMHSVSETSMEYSVDMMLRQWWRDYRLDFSSNSSVEKLELDPKNTDNVWQPDTFFTNEKRAAVHTVTTTNKLMHIFTDGTVLYSMRLAMTLSCTMDLRLYPFDNQNCPLYIQSFAYTRNNINLNWWPTNPVLIDHVEMPKFQLSTNVTIHDYEQTYDTGDFSTLRAEIFMHRKSGFYFLQVFIPSVLLVALSWVSFWVDPNAVPARVSLGVTCVLTMTTQSSGTRQTLPPVSYVKAIDIWMFVCLLFVFAALLEFAYVNVLSRRRALQNSNDDATEETEEMKKKRKREGHKLAQKVDFISRFAFPVSFIIFLSVFAIICAFTPQVSMVPDK